MNLPKFSEIIIEFDNDTCFKDQHRPTQTFFFKEGTPFYGHSWSRHINCPLTNYRDNGNNLTHLGSCSSFDVFFLFKIDSVLRICKFFRTP